MELASFHSASKGYVNECGLRAGYVELHNFDQEVLQTFATALSIKMSLVTKILPRTRLCSPDYMGYGKKNLSHLQHHPFCNIKKYV